MNSLLRSPVVAYGGGSLIVRRATKIKHVFFLLVQCAINNGTYLPS